MKILLSVLISLFALTAQAQTTFEHFTASDEWPILMSGGQPMPNILDPGEFFCTAGGSPTGLFTCEDGNGIHVRGTQMVSCLVNSVPYDPRVEGTVWFDFAANWDSEYTGPVSGNWRIVTGGCDVMLLFDPYPQAYWEGTYTGKRKLVPDAFPPTWVTTLKLVGYGAGDLAGQKMKATEVITTFSPLPMPWELLGLDPAGPEGEAEITIITEE